MASEERNGEAWVIWSLEHGGYWGPNRGGYFPSLLSAGVYSKDEAERIARSVSRDPEKPTEARPLRPELEEATRSGTVAELLALRTRSGGGEPATEDATRCLCGDERGEGVTGFTHWDVDLLRMLSDQKSREPHNSAKFVAYKAALLADRIEASLAAPTVGETEDDERHALFLDSLAQAMEHTAQREAIGVGHPIFADLLNQVAVRQRVAQFREIASRLRSAAGPSEDEPVCDRCVSQGYCRRVGWQCAVAGEVERRAGERRATPAERESGTEEVPREDDISEWDHSILARLRDIRDLISDGAQDEYRHTFIEHRRGFCVVCGNARPHPVHDPGPKWLTGEGSE